MKPEDLPTTWAQAHDLVREMFGIGTYDEIARPEPPFHRARMNEIARLKALGRQRRATPQQVGIAAWFAHRTGVHVRQSVRLFPLIPAAQVAWNRALAEERARVAQEALGDLIEEALAAGEGEWAERFIRASAAEVPSLIEKWRNR